MTTITVTRRPRRHRRRRVGRARRHRVARRLDGRRRVDPLRLAAARRRRAPRSTAGTRVGPVRLTDRMVVTEWDPGRALAVEHRGLVTGCGRFRSSRWPGHRARLQWRESLDVPVVARRATRCGGRPPGPDRACGGATCAASATRRPERASASERTISSSERAASGRPAEVPSGVMLSEPALALTDLVLGTVTLVLALRLRSTPGIHHSWRATFVWTATAALAGFVHHGFMTFFDTIDALELRRRERDGRRRRVVPALGHRVRGARTGPPPGVLGAARSLSLGAYAALAAAGRAGAGSILMAEGSRWR